MKLLNFFKLISLVFFASVTGGVGAYGKADDVCIITVSSAYPKIGKNTPGIEVWHQAKQLKRFSLDQPDAALRLAEELVRKGTCEKKQIGAGDGLNYCPVSISVSNQDVIRWYWNGAPIMQAPFGKSKELLGLHRKFIDLGLCRESRANPEDRFYNYDLRLTAQDSKACYISVRNGDNVLVHIFKNGKVLASKPLNEFDDLLAEREKLIKDNICLLPNNFPLKAIEDEASATKVKPARFSSPLNRQVAEPTSNENNYPAK